MWGSINDDTCVLCGANSERLLITCFFNVILQRAYGMWCCTGMGVAESVGIGMRKCRLLLGRIQGMALKLKSGTWLLLLVCTIFGWKGIAESLRMLDTPGTMFWTE